MRKLWHCCACLDKGSLRTQKNAKKKSTLAVASLCSWSWPRPSGRATRRMMRGSDSPGRPGSPPRGPSRSPGRPRSRAGRGNARARSPGQPRERAGARARRPAGATSLEINPGPVSIFDRLRVLLGFAPAAAGTPFSTRRRRQGTYSIKLLMQVRFQQHCLQLHVCMERCQRNRVK